MKLSHPMLNHPIDWEKSKINSFVIENSVMYRNFIRELYDQVSGMKGEFVLSHDCELLDISKNIEMIGNVLDMDMDNKRIISGIVRELTDIAVNEKSLEINEIYEKINGLISDVIFVSNNDIIFDDINDISHIFKMYNVRPDAENLSLAEKIIMYLELCEKFLNKKIFVLLNLHSFFTKQEMELLLEDIVYRKFNVFLIERYDYNALPQETKRIIDIDLCEI